jgi:hypothetical protein
MEMIMNTLAQENKSDAAHFAAQYEAMILAGDLKTQTLEALLHLRKIAEKELPSHRTAQDIKDDAAARVPLSTVKRGEYFRVNAFENGAVYQRGEYDKSTKSYSCTNQKTSNELNIKGEKMVFVGFEY